MPGVLGMAGGSSRTSWLWGGELWSENVPVSEKTRADVLVPRGPQPINVGIVVGAFVSRLKGVRQYTSLNFSRRS